MALTTCGECLGVVSDRALFCPHCGVVRGALDLEAVLAKMIPPPLLTAAELAAMTGYRQKARQVQWLKDRKIPHTLNAFRAPLVMREQLIVTYGGLADVKRKSKVQTEPNWAAIGLGDAPVRECLPPLLTKNELTILIGLAQKSRQVAWLKENKIPHTLNAHGEPQVSRSVESLIRRCRPLP